MRPESIVQFELVFWVSMALSVVSLLVGWRVMQAAFAQAATAPGAPSLASMTTIGLGSVALTTALYIVLMWFTARRASNVARIIFTVVFGIAILLGLPGLLNAGVPTLLKLIGLVQIVLDVTMLYLLWGRADAQAWFREGARR